ncbi:hypothetical protein JRO89_XS13G0164400 [Xanthoceras sorbifolium]|uniref:Uncharacterized protein n=1 Tax=Xanthoceras sorbifolium TaxID=99658 RepID=A0ABQ8H8N7_9ROSI|nr:hypothetical protein JRO89_XS13G0164400 [Xanthoceras sorbifolium]
MQGNGCTVFNENGDIIYRIDNYEKKRSKEVYLMDLRGKVLFTLQKVQFFGRWEGYKGDGANLKKEKPSFQVTRNGHVTLWNSNNAEAAGCYKLESMAGGKSSSAAIFKIIDSRSGRVVAEAKRKQSSSGVVLGDDVLTLMVEPHVDHSLIIALVTVQPKSPLSSPFLYMTSRRETFTVWMRSLICHTNGCTVYDSNGDVVYRVDNYDQKCRDEVYLMDLRGQVLFIIQKRKSLFFGCWEGYKTMKTGCWSSTCSTNNEKPWFEVKRYCGLLRGYLFCKVRVGHDKYWIERSVRSKSAFRIVDINGDAIAEVNQKQTSSGFLLGEDVLSLKVEPNIDHSFIVALVIVYELINGKM